MAPPILQPDWSDCYNHGTSVYIVKRHFYAREKLMQIYQNGPLDKFIRFLFMRSSALGHTE